MTDRLEQLRTWMDAPESQHLEFKEAKNTFNFDKLLNYCVALANERGGKLILGVTDQRPRRVVGSLAFPDPAQTAAGLLARLHFRVDAEEIAHPDGRVLVFHIPARPIGVPVQLNGVYWMRSGEELVAMTPDQLKRIMEEAEPDFSATLCPGVTLADLDPAAIDLFRERWIRKSGNEALRAVSAAQLLSDADLLSGDQVTYAALILLGTRRALTWHLGQAEVIFEYRSSDVTGPAAQREEFRQGFLPILDALWNLINLRNDKQHFQDGLYIWDIPTFNESAVREVILNAVCHRDYRTAPSIFVRQYPRRLEVVSPGGLPHGITPDNILWRQSPRNRLIASSVERCGLVERAGQGMNRIYEACIRESKPTPDFTQTDDYWVSITLHGKIQDERFLRFLEKVGSERLSSFTTREFVALDLVHREQPIPDDLRDSINYLIDQGAIESAGGDRFILSRSLYAFLGQKGTYTRKRGLDRETNKALLLKHITDNNAEGSKLDELLQVLPSQSARQVQYLLQELKAEDRIHIKGRTQSARWHVGPEPIEQKRRD